MVKEDNIQVQDNEQQQELPGNSQGNDQTEVTEPLAVLETHEDTFHNVALDNPIASDPQQVSQEQPPPPERIPLHLRFDDLTVFRRAALGLLPNVQDPEYNSQMTLSALKSSRRYNFIEPNTVTLDGGYRLCRATRSFVPDNFKYYWEIDFHPTNDGESHIRVGIATCKADTEAPVGIDEEGYSIRDLGGAYHKSKKIPSKRFNSGDTIGFGISLDDEGYSLRYFINGSDEGVVFSGIDRDKQWIPAVSLYRNATVTARFKRPFKFDPMLDWREADDTSIAEPIQNITATQLVNIMRTSLDAGDERKFDVIKAIDTALIPAHLMQN
ncbi:SPRY domain containing protein [Histomonas meleagridis]|uniref:SPRY domain containing protein n=1 Tax=Histomonas meleagridis TaxID=135588 RepID=UPI00355A1F01|nr:SPRY domain containing protein [Histomonas meleagridis]KAH0805457.1 SPRY domain containing protein [Histomonas meleagridis]